MFRYLKKKMHQMIDQRMNNNFLKFEWLSADSIVNEKPKSDKRIVFVVPPMAKGAGGITSILRLGTYLNNNGHDVFYAIHECFDYEDQYEKAKACLENFSGKIISFEEAKSESFDIVIATEIISVYYAKKLSGYKMIFVQDYEPLFFNTGDYSCIAEKVYTMGFHLVSLGEWNKYMIEKNIKDNVKIDTIPFPYEKKEYTYKNRNYNELKNKKELQMCVYIRNTPRRMPGFCQLIAKKLTEKFREDGVTLKVVYYGEDTLKYKYGENLGKLTKIQLNKLYQDSDFGLVASGTNISLVPYEMLATGLPIIEFKNGSFPYFFSEEDAFLFDLNYDKLYEEIKYAINNPQILIDRDKRIQEKLGTLSWDDSAKEFCKILTNIINNG